MDPRTRPRISWFLSGIVVSGIGQWIFQVVRDLVMTCLDLLEKYDIWIVLFDEVFEFSFVRDGSDAVDIPGDDTHRKKVNIR